MILEIKITIKHAFGNVYSRNRLQILHNNNWLWYGFSRNWAWENWRVQEVRWYLCQICLEAKPLSLLSSNFQTQIYWIIIPILKSSPFLIKSSLPFFLFPFTFFTLTFLHSLKANNQYIKRHKKPFLFSSPSLWLIYSMQSFWI